MSCRPHPVHSFPPRHRADARGDATAAVDRAELTAAGSTLTLALDNQVVGSWPVQPATTPSPSVSPSASAASPTATASGSSPVTSPTSSVHATPAATPTGVPSAPVTPEPSPRREATPAESATGNTHDTGRHRRRFDHLIRQPGRHVEPLTWPGPTGHRQLRLPPTHTDSGGSHCQASRVDSRPWDELLTTLATTPSITTSERGTCCSTCPAPRRQGMFIHYSQDPSAPSAASVLNSRRLAI